MRVKNLLERISSMHPTLFTPFEETTAHLDLCFPGPKLMLMVESARLSMRALSRVPAVEQHLRQVAVVSETDWYVNGIYGLYDKCYAYTKQYDTAVQ